MDKFRGRLALLRVVQELADAFGFKFYLILVDDEGPMIQSRGLTHSDAFKVIVKDLGLPVDETEPHV